MAVPQAVSLPVLRLVMVLGSTQFQTNMSAPLNPKGIALCFR
jgi:hypothetical protein